MSIPREKVLRWFTIAIIVIFFIEFFYVIMFVPSQNAKPSATPTTPAVFSGQAVALARVTGFSEKLFLSCNTTSPILETELRGIGGVANVFSVTGTSKIIVLNSSLSGDNASGTIAAVSEIVGAGCTQPVLLREAFLEFSEKLTAYDVKSLGSNSSREIYPQTLEEIYRGLGKQAPAGYVDSGTALNASVQVAVFVKMLGDRFADVPYIEEIHYKTGIETGSPLPSPSLPPEELNASIETGLDDLLNGLDDNESVP